MKGDAVTHPHPIIRIFLLCESMKWNHLPVAGGLYDQHPDLIKGFEIIFDIRAEHEAQEAAKEKKAQGRGRGRRGASMRG